MKILIALLLLLVTGCGRGYSEGSRAGSISKLSHKGVFVKSWEGELLVGGMVTDGEGNAVPNVWEFTVKDDSLVQRFLDAQSSGTRIQIKYVEWIVSPFSMESSYEAVGVK